MDESDLSGPCEVQGLPEYFDMIAVAMCYSRWFIAGR